MRKATFFIIFVFFYDDLMLNHMGVVVFIFFWIYESSLVKDPSGSEVVLKIICVTSNSMDLLTLEI